MTLLGLGDREKRREAIALARSIIDLDFNVVMETFGFDPVLEEAAHAETEGASAKEALAAACAVDA